MRRLIIVLLLTTATGISSGCMATRKFTRNEVKNASDQLNARVDTTNEQLDETRGSLDRVREHVTGVDGRVNDLDTRTTQGLNSLKTDVSNVDQKAAEAQLAADRTSGQVVILDRKFQNRNQYTVAGEHAILFKFDSSELQPPYFETLDEAASALAQNPDAIIVMEGHTDSVGGEKYNLQLGERRVDSVRRYLAIEKEVPLYKLYEISMGAAKPVASNDSKDGRMKNRVVTVTVLVPRTEGTVASSQ